MTAQAFVRGCVAAGTLAVLFAAGSAPAVALPPADIFARISRGIVVVEGLDVDGKTVSQGSGVLFMKDTVVTNCHVLRNTSKVVVTHANRIIPARPLAGNRVRDICILSVPGSGNTTIKSVTSGRILSAHWN